MFHPKYLVLLSVSIISTVSSQSKPWFCKQNECPLFKSETANNGVENRTYPAETTWVGTSVTATTDDLSWTQTSTMFRKLFRYITGTNSQNLQINMTAPVLTRFEETGSDQYEVTMLFYLAVPNPPTPTDPTVFLHSVGPNSNFFVKSYRTLFMIDWGKDYYLHQLRQAAQENNMSYDVRVYYKAGYNKPTDFIQYNELWLESL